MEDIVFTPEEVRDISEVRDLVRTNHPLGRLF